MLEAVKQDGSAMGLASEALRMDQGFVLMAASYYTKGSFRSCFAHASETLMADKEFVLMLAKLGFDEALTLASDALMWQRKSLCSC